MSGHSEDLKPKQWTLVYALVIGFLLLEIVLMSLLTINYID